MAQWPLLVVLCSFISVGPASADGPFLPPLKQKILVPGYWAPCHDPSDPHHGAMDCDWDQIASDTASGVASAVGAVVINPASGPGPACQPAYLNLTARLRAADDTWALLGYTHTSYGARPVAEVEAEIDAYLACYPFPLITGFFLDEASGDCADLPYYASLSEYIRARLPAPGAGANASFPGLGATVVINPGYASSECYLAANASSGAGAPPTRAASPDSSDPHSTSSSPISSSAGAPVPVPLFDSVVVFEGNFSFYNATWAPPPWHSSYPPPRFTHIVYGVPGPDELLQTMRLSKTRNGGGVYATNLTLAAGNPYAGLPRPYIFWDMEVRWAVDIV